MVGFPGKGFTTVPDELKSYAADPSELLLISRPITPDKTLASSGKINLAF